MITVALSIILAMTGTNTVLHSGSDTIDSTTKVKNFSILVAAMKPIRNLHVTYRGQTYTIREGVSTVNELTARFERLNNNLGNMGNHISPKGIVWKGRILKMGDDLSKAGIKHGDRVMILPGDKDTKAVDILAVYLFLLSSNEKAIEEAINVVKRDQPEAYDALKDLVNTLRDGCDINRKDVANFLRNAFDLSYHRLRSWWEHPSLRQGLHDPDRIENYRQVVTTNLSSKFLKKISSSSQLQKIIESPDLWRREFSKRATKAIRFGDTILEGILDLLLDVLKGTGSSHARSNPYFSGSNRPSPEAQQQHQGDGAWSPPASEASNLANTVTSEMDDPSLANNLLFELSDSEDNSDLDEF